MVDGVHFEASPPDEKALKLQMLFKDVTDTDLLLELRRRGRIGRVDYHLVVPSYAVAQGYPVEDQIRHCYKGLGNALGVKLNGEITLPGSKVEYGRFDDFPGCGDPHQRDRKVTLVVNYITGL